MDGCNVADVWKVIGGSWLTPFGVIILPLLIFRLATRLQVFAHIIFRSRLNGCAGNHRGARESVRIDAWTNSRECAIMRFSYLTDFPICHAALPNIQRTMRVTARDFTKPPHFKENLEKENAELSPRRDGQFPLDTLSRTCCAIRKSWVLDTVHLNSSY